MNRFISGECFLILIQARQQRRFPFQVNKIRTDIYHLILMIMQFKPQKYKIILVFYYIKDLMLIFILIKKLKIQKNSQRNEAIVIQYILSQFAKRSFVTIQIMQRIYMTNLVMYNLNEIWGDYNVCFAITDPIQRTNKVSVNPEIGLNSLSTRRWYQNFFFLQNSTWSFSSLSNSLHEFWQ